MGTNVQSLSELCVQFYSVIELWVEVYRLLQNCGYKDTAFYGIMRASVESVMELWVQVYDGVTELLLYI